MTGTSRRFSAASEVHARKFHDELVVLNLRTGEYFSLDAFATQIWERLVAGDDLEQIVLELAPNYAVEASELQRDVERFADELVRSGLVHLRPETER